MAVTLFPHNQTAYVKVVDLLEKQKKAAVIHPTGTGKTFVAFKLAEEHPGARLCWLAPSEYIFRSQRENFLRAGGSEETLQNITFLTYARLMWNEETMEELKPEYIILDEFHRCGAAEWGKSVSKLLGAYPEAKVLGLSATNVRYLDGQRDMAEELFGGRIASHMSLGEAIVQEILPAPTYVIALYSYQKALKKVQGQVENLNNPVQRKECEGILEKLRRSLHNADGPDQIFQKYLKPAGKYLVFCANKEHMDEMMELASEWFRRVDGEPHIYQAYYDSSESRQQFSDFCADGSSHLKLLYCIDMLNEGIHVADVDGVILLRPTISPILYLQQVGRALSSTQNKQPVILDLVNNFDGLYSIDSLQEQIEEAFCILPDSLHGKWQERFQIRDEVRGSRELFEQLRRSLTASWEIYYRAAEQYYSEHADLNVPKTYISEDGLALGSWIAAQRKVRRGSMPGELTEEQIKRLDRLEMVWDDILDYKWMEGYRHLQAYLQAHGNLDVPSRYRAEDGYGLGRWLRAQRVSRAEGNLLPERARLLEELGVLWDVQDVEWNKFYAAAAAYYRQNGHLRVPSKYVTEEGVPLGAWISARRSGRDRLPETKIALLDRIGMVWESSFRERWNQNYSLAEQFFRENGHLNVPVNYETGGVRLGRWVSRMRESRLSGARTPLTEEQIRALDAIGMIWESSWDIRFEAARDYYESHGNLRVPQTYVTSDRIWLGKWLYEQKRKYGQPGRRGLTEGQIRKLESIGMSWE